ncbi:hypothetical protein ABHC75_13980 [Parabacteroides distasonis]|uniref:hypothetical protein n=1 Tax=Parabacteroides distasonis TaxID=823 RepID=UPI00325C2614
MKQTLSLFIVSLAFCTSYCSPKGIEHSPNGGDNYGVDHLESLLAIHYNSFSHNDCWREIPSMDALSFRFNCVEADLWLINGELYVSHDHPEPAPIIAFENLHLKPFTACIQANDGKIYPGSDRPMNSPPKENSRFTLVF